MSGRRRGRRRRERRKSSLLYLGRERQAVAEVLRYLVDTGTKCCFLLLLPLLARELLFFELEGQGESGVGIGVYFSSFL